MLQTFLIVWLGVIAAQASPGPNMFAVAEVALGRGRKAALMVVAGIASGTFVWCALTAIGLGAAITAMPILLTILKLFGGAYLCFLGYRGLRGAWQCHEAKLKADASPMSDVAAWRRGIFVVLTNPKAPIMWTAVATFLFGAGMGSAEVLAFGPLVAISAAGIYGAYGILFSTSLASRGYAKFWRAFEALFGLSFSALGVTLLISGLRDIRP
jgi:threonine efflux protein